MIRIYKSCLNTLYVCTYVTQVCISVGKTYTFLLDNYIRTYLQNYIRIHIYTCVSGQSMTSNTHNYNIHYTPFRTQRIVWSTPPLKTLCYCCFPYNWSTWLLFLITGNNFGFYSEAWVHDILLTHHYHDSH